jgi:hypothetical protein
MRAAGILELFLRLERARDRRRKAVEFRHTAYRGVSRSTQSRIFLQLRGEAMPVQWHGGLPAHGAKRQVWDHADDVRQGRERPVLQLRTRAGW